MVTELPQRTSYSGPALVRLLSRLSHLEVAQPRHSLAARLDDWLGWTESIVLSKVLAVNASAAERKAAGPGVREAPAGLLEQAEADYTLQRDTLEQAITASLAPPAPLTSLQRRQIRGAPKVALDVDFPSYRRRYSLLQQKMEGALAPLRARMRKQLATMSPSMAQLAAVDAAMEQALAERELILLNGIAKLLERRFHHLAKQAPAMPSAWADQVAEGPPEPLAPGPWIDEFRQDMRGVLLAELDLRLQPHQGLLRALRGG